MEYRYSYKKGAWAGYHVQISNCGHQVCDSEFYWGFGVREQYLFHYVKKGGGTLYLDGKKYSVSEGGLFFIPPKVRVKYVASKSSPWEYLWVGFSGLDAGRLTAKTTFSVDKPVGVVENSSDRELIISAMQKVYQNSGKEHDNTLLMFGGFFEFFALISRLFPKAKESSSTDVLRKATNFISQNYQRDITVEEIAEVVSISRSQLYRHFMQNMEISPIDFLTSIRIEKAKTLLLETNISIEEVSNSVGFASSIYFSRLFKKHENQSPLAYRKENKTELEK